MDGGGDNQLTDRNNHLRPMNRRLQMILRDYQRWEQHPTPTLGHRSAARAMLPLMTQRGIVLHDIERITPAPLQRTGPEGEDSGFESGSES